MVLSAGWMDVCMWTTCCLYVEKNFVPTKITGLLKLKDNFSESGSTP